MKIFITYKFTGERREDLEQTVGNLTRFLENKGHKVYCTLEDRKINSMSKNVLFDFALKEIDNSETLIIFLNSEEKSEGMLMEIGYALAKNKRIILLIKRGVIKTHLRELIKEKYEFSDMDNLYKQLETLK